jgi:hypothetical protein
MAEGNLWNTSLEVMHWSFMKALILELEVLQLQDLPLLEWLV